MLGILVQLLISWVLIHFIEKKNLSVLGFRPTAKRLSDFVLFFLLTAACCFSGFLLRMHFGREVWGVNPLLNVQLLLEGAWWNIKSVLFEELIFRGVVLYILIRRVGVAWALLISAVVFGIYHWFSFEIFGQVKMMIYVFFLTGIMGLLLAFGYSKTLSLYIPCAIHLGWNITRGFVFSEGSIGKGVFILLEQPIVNVSWFTYCMIEYFPLASALLAGFLILRKRKQVELKNKV